MLRNALSVVLLSAFLSLAAHAAEPAPATTPASTGIEAAAWGPYGQLVGRSWSMEGGYRVSWQWLAPGRELSELWVSTKDGKVVQTNVIRPGAQAGQLVLNSSLLAMNLSWQGRVQADGAVVWARDGLIKLPYRLRIDADGIVRYEGVKLKDEQVTEVKYAYVLTPAEAVGNAVVATAAASPAVANPVATPATATAPAQVMPAAVPAAVASVPVADPLPPPPPPTPAELYGPLAAYIGQRMIGETTQLELLLVGDDTLVIQFYTASGRAGGRYRIQPSREQPGTLELLENPFGKNARAKAQLRADGSLHLDSLDGWIQGWRYQYDFKPTADGIATTFNSEFKNQLRITIDSMGGTDNERGLYRPMTEERAVEAVVAARIKAENDRIARENRIRQQEERNAQVAAAFSGFVQGMSGAMADNNRQRAQQQAFLDETAIRAQAIADYRQQQQAQQQRAAEEQRRQQQASRDAQAQQVSANQQATASQQAEANRQAQATQAAQREAEQQRLAAQKAEQQRLAAEQAAAERQRQADARKLAEAQARERQQQAWQQSLLQARNSLRLHAATCMAGEGRYYVIGPKAPVNGCVTVHYEARCPGTPAGRGARGSQGIYVGGTCAGLGDRIAIPGSPLGCPVEQVIVSVTDVTGCN